MNTIITVPNEAIISKIFSIRGKKVMLDEDLAQLYEVPTGDLNRAVKRNQSRFPLDFMFQLSKIEFENLLCQFGIARWGGRRNPPSVFTEQGVAMLSSVLHSPRAIQVNIQIIRIFTKLREILASNKNLTDKLDSMERKYDKHVYNIFAAIKELKGWQEKREYFEIRPKEKLGFRRPGE